MTNLEGAVVPQQQPERSSGYVQSLDRGLAVIRAFDAEHPRLTLSDVARRTGLTRAAARRFLHTLVDLGYVAADGRLFALRPRVMELGYAYLATRETYMMSVPSRTDADADSPTALARRSRCGRAISGRPRAAR